MRKVMLLFGLMLSVSCTAAAQESPVVQAFSLFEFYGGYNFTRVHNSDANISIANGGSADVGFFQYKGLGLIAGFGGSHSSGYTTSTGIHVNTSSKTFPFLFGPRYSLSASDRLTPFVQALFGGIYRTDLVNTTTHAVLSNEQTSFAAAFSGGVDVKVNRHLSVRVAQVGFQFSQFHPVNGAHNNQLDLTISSGIVFH